jgi:LPS sulfotransferase NodH
MMELLNQEFDMPAYTEGPPRTSYVVCSTPRSGSTLLCRLLKSTGVAGFPMEYFNRHRHLPALRKRFGVSQMGEVARRLRETRTSPNGCFGFKAHYDQFLQLGRKANLDELFPNLRYILIDRLDLLEQAVSYSRALQTGAWQSTDSARAEPVLDHQHVVEALEYIANRKQMWSTFFALTGLSFHRLTYEELCRNPQRAVDGVIDFLGLEGGTSVDLSDAPTRIQRDEETVRWMEAVRERYSLAEFGRQFNSARLPRVPMSTPRKD